MQGGWVPEKGGKLRVSRVLWKFTTGTKNGMVINSTYYHFKESFIAQDYQMWANVFQEEIKRLAQAQQF